MILVKRSELIFGLFLLFNFILTLFVALTLGEEGSYIGGFLFNMFLVSITLLLGHFCFQGNYKGALSIPSLVSISIFFFMWARPFLTLFFDKDVVEAGIVLGESSVSKSIVILALGFIFIAFGYLVTQGVSLKLARGLVKIPVLAMPRLVNGVVIFFALCSGTYFLAKSFILAQKYMVGDYFAALENPEFHAHIFTFFIAKNLLLLWGVFGRDSNRLLIISFVWVFFALGFLMIGLRGYFFAYLFLFVFVYGLERQINYFFLMALGIGSLIFANMLLEYRLGFEVASGVMAKISQTLHGQGASFEVLYGAVNFDSAVTHCLKSTDQSFGICVDQARSINFASGGFSTSFFAEAYYQGWLFYLLWCLLLGCLVRTLDWVVAIYKENRTAPGNHGGVIFLVLSVLPNLVYFSRSNMHEFLLKFLQVSIALVIIGVVLANVNKYRGVSR
ncbi:hypothetical protein [Pseudomonas sp. 24 R 17]|uniref:hypothetical protein n=1 Tax=Pseudomonas sp. 24 R 17 TaxID=1844096 RepID=UPI000812BB13|nr:hypothetical protein [Pseudomonas sp. 24 R 17]CRM17752.1 hypothetical protein [Pseudomonas sp. 24 R 17]